MTSATPDTSTAEWVAEAPSECAGGATSDCTPLPLAGFGKATFSDAHTTSNGHVGSISDSNWTTEAIELQPSSSSLFGGGPGGYFQGGYGGGYSENSSYEATSGSAAPSSLSEGGTKFTVTYGAALQTSSSGTGQGESNPYAGSGYGDSYGGGYGGGYGAGYGDGYSYERRRLWRLRQLWLRRRVRVRRRLGLLTTRAGSGARPMAGPTPVSNVGSYLQFATAHASMPLEAFFSFA